MRESFWGKRSCSMSKPPIEDPVFEIQCQLRLTSKGVALFQRVADDPALLQQMVRQNKVGEAFSLLQALSATSKEGRELADRIWGFFDEDNTSRAAPKFEP
jgi:hypothetical protein